VIGHRVVGGNVVEGKSVRQGERGRRASSPHTEYLSERPSSAKKAARKIVARTEINRNRRGRVWRGRVRTFLRKVEEALAAGD
jgi:hypothetical protein